jgi:hypothetical protein
MYKDEMEKEPDMPSVRMMDGKWEDPDGEPAKWLKDPSNGKANVQKGFALPLVN